MAFLPNSIETNGKNHTHCIEASFSIISTTLTKVNDVIFCHWKERAYAVVSNVFPLMFWNTGCWKLCWGLNRNIYPPFPHTHTHNFLHLLFTTQREGSHFLSSPAQRVFQKLFEKLLTSHIHVLLLQKAPLVFLWYLLLGNLIQNYN